MLLSLLLLSQAFATCDPADLEPSLDDTEAAFVRGDNVAAHLAAVRTRRALRCTHDPLPTAVAARIHRASALSRYLRRDGKGVERSLRGMLHADPTRPLPLDLVPQGHPLQRARLAAEEALVSWKASLGKPRLVDGLRTQAVPEDQHYVSQRLDGVLVKGGHLHQRTTLYQRARIGYATLNQSAKPSRDAFRVGLGVGIGGVALLATSAVAGLANAASPGEDPALATGATVTGGLGLVSLVGATGTFTGAEIARRRQLSRPTPVDYPQEAATDRAE